MASDGGIWDRILLWLKTYGFENIPEAVNETTRRLLSEAIQGFVERPITMGDLREAIEPIFGPARATRIAVTEVTRAYAAAGHLAADEARAEGWDVVDRWNRTSEYDCEECAANDGKLRGDGWTEDPPAHPNCQCYLTFEVA